MSQLLSRIEQHLHDFVDSGSAQELFIASYVHGHFDLVQAQILQDLDNRLYPDDEQLILSRVHDCLAAQFRGAFADGELKPSDQAEVWSLLDDICTL